MGIIEKELAEFELESGQKCHIEHDKDGTIHLHIGMFRIHMTESEFKHFAKTVSESQTELHQRKRWN